MSEISAPMSSEPVGAATGAPLLPVTDPNVQALLDRVKERGFVTTGEIFAALPDLEPETFELAAIYESIRARGIEVVDEIVEELQREDERRAVGAPDLPPALPSSKVHNGAVESPPGATPTPVLKPRTESTPRSG